MSTDDHRVLRRTVGLPGAVLLGLGSILGTGVFVALGTAVDLAGVGALAAVALAAALAAANGLSSAQLAANLPVSGGTYAYGRHWIGPTTGFIAGWTFLCAKVASAAAAAQGVVAYGAALLAGGAWPEARWIEPLLAVAVVLAIGLLVLGGVRRSNAVNAILVAAALAALAAFVAAAAPAALARLPSPTWTPRPESAPALLEATAILFVAYTGYGRIATLGEEVREPRRTVPRAIVLSLAAIAAIYLVVLATGLAAVGVEGFARAAGGDPTVVPLARVAGDLGHPALETVVRIGAVGAMLGVILNLVLGVSRVVLAMGRSGDLPGVLGRVDAQGVAPGPAVVATTLAIAAIAALVPLRTAWAFSAFAVLVYYAITNLAALRLSPSERFLPRWIAWAGLTGCAFLAWWVPPGVWLSGCGIVALGLVGRRLGRA